MTAGNVVSVLRTDRLKSLRELRRWSRRELALRCGLATNAIGRYEAGLVDPTASSLKAMADALDVSTDYLVGITDDPRRQYIPDTIAGDEREILEIYRREGWPGIARLIGEQLATKAISNG